VITSIHRNIKTQILKISMMTIKDQERILSPKTGGTKKS